MTHKAVISNIAYGCYLVAGLIGLGMLLLFVTKSELLMGSAGPETSRLLIAAFVGPIVIVPACVLLELAATRLDFSLVPLLSGYVFGEGDFAPPLGLAVGALVIVFYPAIFLLGIPAALVLRRIDKPEIMGLVGAPLLLAVILGLTKEHSDLKIVFAYCAIVVSAGCWGFYWIYR